MKIPEFISIKDVSEFLGKQPQWVRRHMHEFVTMKVGNRYFISTSSIKSKITQPAQKETKTFPVIIPKTNIKKQTKKVYSSKQQSNKYTPTSEEFDPNF